MKQDQVKKEDTKLDFDHIAFIKQCGTKSSAIRKLTVEGKKRNEIAKLLKIRYQHVRNVLITPIKKQREVIA